MSGPHTTTTEQVLFRWWIILSTVSVCHAGVRGSDTAELLEFLNAVHSIRHSYLVGPSCVCVCVYKVRDSSSSAAVQCVLVIL